MWIRTTCRRSRLARYGPLLVAAVVVLAAAAPAAAQVVLSEIRIDQPSTDVDEYFELAGTPGDSLAGLTYLVIGDGTGGSGVVEAVVDLGTASIPASGFFVAAESSFTLGTADLVTSLNFENSDNVTHLLVSGFLGSSGDDLDLDDDGSLDVTPWSQLLDCVALIETVGSGEETYCATTVGPDGSFVPAHVLLCPDGFEIGPFDPASGLDTPGSGNACGGGPGPGEPAALVINEIDYDQPGTDEAEFIEILNPTADSVELAGFVLELINGTGGGASVYRTIPLPAVSLAAGEYFVVCGNAGRTVNCDLDVTPDTNLIQNGAPDAVALTVAGLLIDTVSYEGDTGAPFTEGSGTGLEDPGSGGVGGPNENQGISRFPDGVDTDQNNVDLSTRCASPGTANVAATEDCPSPPRLVINEVDYDQPGSDTAEFIELRNNGNQPVSLDGVSLRLINGSGGGASVYRTIPLPPVSLAAGGYFVVCGNAAEARNCDLDVTPSSNLIQNGSPDAVALFLDDLQLDTVSYEGDTGAPFTEGSGVGLEDPGSGGAGGANENQGISRFPDGADTDVNNLDLRTACITPGRSNTAVAALCGAEGPLLEIFDIQGGGSASPFAGQTVSTAENVVSALGLDGFFIQTPTARSDGDVDTSDGIFVFTGGAPAVEVGDLVDVTGQVQEFFGFTEVAGQPAVDVTSPAGGVVPAAVTFDAATPSPDPSAPSCAIELECYEGMLVEVADGTVSGPNQRFGTDPVAEVHIVAAPERAFREPGLELPGLPSLPVWDGNPEVFELDPDKLGLDNEEIPAGSPFSARGVIGFEFGGYELWPTELSFDPEPLPVPVRRARRSELTVGTLNLFRLFDDVDDPEPEDDGQVVSASEYALRLAKLSLYIRDVLRSPDILAVQEAEKLGVLEDLAATILAVDPAVLYTPLLLEGNDVGGIDVGYLVRERVDVLSLAQFGKDLTFEHDDTTFLTYDRPPLVLEAALGGDDDDDDEDGEDDDGDDDDDEDEDDDDDEDAFRLTVIANHLRSLGGIDGSEGARVRTKRFEQALRLSELIQGLQTADPAIRLVVTGDFNAFEFTDGFVDVMGQVTGNLDPAGALVPGVDLVEPDLANRVLDLPAEERYSFIFGGSAQVLDHSLTSVALDRRVRGVAYGRGNADAPRILEDDGGTPLRASDHDGLVLYLSLDDDDDDDDEEEDEDEGGDEDDD